MKQTLLSAVDAYDLQVKSLIAELSAYPEAVLNRRPADGGWSAVQTMVHLILSEELSLAYVRKKMSYGVEDIENAGLAHWFRNMGLWVFLYLPFKFKAPKGVADEHLPEFCTLEEVQARWEVIRGEWKRFLEALPNELLPKAIPRHPRAGRQSWRQTLNFFKWHLARHRQQILRAVRQV